MWFATLIREAVGELAHRRRVFHSEADLQHELAMQITRMDPTVAIRLERPVRNPGHPPVNLDMMLRRGDEQYAVELKYPTARLEATVDGETFLLTAQSAQDTRRYDILKDIARLENIVQSGIAVGGTSLTITNDNSFSLQGRSGTSDEAFRLHCGRTVSGELRWSERTGAGTMRDREAAINLSGSYLLEWADYSHIEVPKNGDFQMLVVEVEPLRRG